MKNIKETGLFEKDGIIVSIGENKKKEMYVFFGISVNHPLAYRDITNIDTLKVEFKVEGARDNHLEKHIYYYGVKVTGEGRERVERVVRAFVAFNMIKQQLEQNEH